MKISWIGSWFLSHFEKNSEVVFDTFFYHWILKAFETTTFTRILSRYGETERVVFLIGKLHLTVSIACVVTDWVMHDASLILPLSEDDTFSIESSQYITASLRELLAI